jgi:hypothetical protein
MTQLDEALEPVTRTGEYRQDRNNREPLSEPYRPLGGLAVSHTQASRRGTGVAGGTAVRIVVVGLLPTASLMVVVLGLLASGAPTTSPNVARLMERVGGLRLSHLLALAVCALALTILVQPFQLRLLRLFEGYGWEGFALGRAIRRIGIQRQLRRLQRLDQMAFSVAGNAEEAQRQLLATVQRRAYYPSDPASLLPTRLGNALRAAEDRAGQRYGLDTNACMPRLYPHLSERLTQVLNDRRNQLDVAVRLCAVLLLATVISTPILVGDGWWLAVPAATGLLAWVAYRGAVYAAVNYGQALYVAFDLHRFDMVRGLHYSPPPREREQAFNSELSEFLRGEIDQVSYPYAHPDTPTTPPAARSWLSLLILRASRILRSRSAEKSQDIDRKI